ncbi:MAG: hypothetical protein HY650_07545 [Acidobacteria bacterium]|nr:hypothetical protein [Acidobacteriota bacterium]
MARCEGQRVLYVLGFARNKRLRQIIEAQMREAAQEHERTALSLRPT